MRRFYNSLLGGSGAPPTANLRIWSTAEDAVLVPSTNTIQSIVNRGTEGGSWLQSTATNRATLETGGINGKPFIRCDGINDFYTLATPNDFYARMVFVVANYTKAATFVGADGIFSQPSPSLIDFNLHGNLGLTTLRYPAPASATNFVNSATSIEFAPLSDVKIFGWRHWSGFVAGSKSHWRIFRDRELANRFWGGDFYEILVYDQNPDNTFVQADFDRAYNYLKTKYGIG